jgi:hypothetical protein
MFLSRAIGFDGNSICLSLHSRICFSLLKTQTRFALKIGCLDFSVLSSSMHWRSVGSSSSSSRRLGHTSCRIAATSLRSSTLVVANRAAFSFASRSTRKIRAFFPHHNVLFGLCIDRSTPAALVFGEKTCRVDLCVAFARVSQSFGVAFVA